MYFRLHHVQAINLYQGHSGDGPSWVTLSAYPPLLLGSGAGLWPNVMHSGRIPRWIGRDDQEWETPAGYGASDCSLQNEGEFDPIVICFLPAGPLAPGFMPVFSMASAGATLSVVPTAADQPGPSKPTLPEVNASIQGLALIPPQAGAEGTQM